MEGTGASITAFLSQIPGWIALHPYIAYGALFVVAMAESLAIVGILVPGVVLMFGFGALIATNAMSFWPSLAAAVAGAVLGDGLSFFLGRAYKARLSTMWPFSTHPDMLHRGVGFFKRYGGKSIIFGRFVGPVRAVVPLVAGMLGMRPGRFFAANVASALAWAPAYLLPGMVFGASLELASEVAFRLVVLLLVLLAVLWGTVWAVRRLFRLLQPHARQWVQRLFQWGRAHPKIGEIATALTDPTHPEGTALAVLATVLLLASTTFALILGAVLGGIGIPTLDQWVLDALQSLRTPWADHLMVHFSRLTNLPVALSFSLGVLAWFIWNHHRRSALYWLAASLFAFLVPHLLKMVIKTPRPDIGLGTIYHDGAFPGAHTLTATVLFVFLAVIVARTVSVNRRWIPYSLAALLTTAVAVSRLYLGVHWLSDVLGSITLGLTWVAILGIAYNRHTRPESGWRGITATAALFLIFAFSVQTWRHHDEELARYRPIRLSIAMDAEIWWLSEWALLPKVRDDLVGRTEHPLDVQYAGSLRELKLLLRGKGWYPAMRLEWANVLKLLSPSLPFDDLPVFPQVHDGRHEALIMEKRLHGKRLVLRLWASGYRLEAPAAPLWIGNVSRLKRSSLLGLLVFPSTDPDFKAPFKAFQKDIGELDHWLPPPGKVLLLKTLDFD